ncbi:hypothetical protein A2U01_0108375, partial [Trifolium medium]|nr:hypothetical protein [Trifolium medium]
TFTPPERLASSFSGTVGTSSSLVPASRWQHHLPHTLKERIYEDL